VPHLFLARLQIKQCDQSLARSDRSKRRNLVHSFAAFLVFSLISSLHAQVAHAGEDTEVANATFEDDTDEAPVLINQRVPLKLKVEIAALFMPTLVEKYLNHIGGSVAVNLHLTDWIAVELLGGYVYMRETSIIGGAAGVRYSIATERGEVRDPNLPDLVGMSWFVQAGANISPLYGKLNFFSEFDLSAQLYLCGGIGVVGAVKRQISDASAPNEVPITNLVPNPGGAVKLAGNFGLGFRFFFNKWFAIRGEFRDFVFSDSFVFGTTGAADVDIIHNFMGLVGLSFVVN
jgi:outer membrane beta-barrel protein